MVMTLCMSHQATISYFYGAIRYIEEHIIIAVSAKPDITVICIHCNLQYVHMGSWAKYKI